MFKVSKNKSSVSWRHFSSHCGSSFLSVKYWHHMYLNFRSSHPKHIKINIPFNLASRIIAITNTEELRDTRLRELRLYLKNQQYPEEIVVIMLLFVDIRIKTSKNGISILLLFMVKRIWSFKELSSVWKISTGIKMAPTYATLVLGYLEHILYEQLLNSYGQEFASYVRQSWKRFLDDCFIIWNSDIPVEIFHKNKFFRKAILYNVSFIFQPKCYCRNSQIMRNICIKTYSIKTDEFRIWIYGRRQMGQVV
jgi:hypothetical protein